MRIGTIAFGMFTTLAIWQMFDVTEHPVFIAFVLLNLGFTLYAAVVEPPRRL